LTSKKTEPIILLGRERGLILNRLFLFLWFITLFSFLSPACCQKQEATQVSLRQEASKQGVDKGTLYPLLKTGTGWSSHTLEELAVSEAVNRMLASVRNPAFAMVFNTASYDTFSIHKYLMNRLGNSKLFGMNSYQYVITNDGFHGGEQGAIGLLGLETEKLIIGTAVGELTDPFQTAALTEKVVLEAMREAGKTKADKPLQVFVGCANTPEERVVEVLTAILGTDVPINGGTSADNKLNKGVEFVYDEAKIVGRGIAIAMLYAKESAPVRLGNAFISGYAGTKKMGEVTGIREFTGEHSRVIETIDGKPAGEVYNEWTGFLITQQLKTGASIFAEGHMYPLSVIKDFQGKKQYLTICPGSVDPRTGGLFVFAQPNLHDKVVYTEGSVDALIKRISPTIKDALVNGEVKIKELAGAYIIYCRGAYGALGDRYAEIYTEAKTVMQDKPFLMGLTAGEIGHIPGHGSFHGNLMTTAVIFSE
jgi:hypothetical protein